MTSRGVFALPLFKSLASAARPAAAIALSAFAAAWAGAGAGPAFAADNPYAGEWTLHSLDGDKVLPYWTASIGGGKFILRTNSPSTKCATTASMELEGNSVTFTTTSTNCKGDSKGDVDQGSLSLFGKTLTFLSKTHGKKWVFVQVTKEKPATKVAAGPSAPGGKSAAKAAPSRPASNNPIVAENPQEPSDLERITLTNPGSTTPMGEVYFSWMAVKSASRYDFSLEGTEDGGGLVENAVEMYNSMCDGVLCGQTRGLKPGYYTARVDSFYKKVSSKVKLTVGAPEDKPAPKGKKPKAPPPPPTPPADIVGPVGPVKEPAVSVLQWVAMPGASTYSVNILKKGDAPENAIVHVGDHELLCKAEPCSVTLPNPIAAGDYVWWVEAELISYGKERSFYVIDPTKPKKTFVPPSAAPEQKKKKKSWRDGPG